MQLYIAYVAGSKDDDCWIYGGSALAYVVEGVTQILEHSVLIAVVYQPLVHMTIAINRLAAFAFPLRHSTIWSRRTVTVSTLGMTTVAILLVVIPLLYNGVLFAVDPIAGHTPYGDITWDVEAVSFHYQYW